MFEQYHQALILLAVAAGTATALIAISHLAGHVTGSRTKTYPYECGSLLVDTSRKRINIRFYVVAMIFILFDIEAAFLYPWAVLFRDLGLAGLIEMLVFIAILLVGYVYIWRRGAFDWE